MRRRPSNSLRWLCAVGRGLILDVIEVFRRQPDGSFPCEAELTRDAHGVLTTPLMPGLVIPLDELLAAI